MANNASFEFNYHSRVAQRLKQYKEIFIQMCKQNHQIVLLQDQQFMRDVNDYKIFYVATLSIDLTTEEDQLFQEFLKFKCQKHINKLVYHLKPCEHKKITISPYTSRFFGKDGEDITYLCLGVDFVVE